MADVPTRGSSRGAPFLRRAREALAAARLRLGVLRRVERSTRAEVLEFQRRRLQDLLVHTAVRSAFYRRSWGGGVPRAADLGALPPTSRQELLGARFDEALTEPGVTRESLQRLLGAEGQGAHVVLATSGTTGEPVIIPYARCEWVEGLAYVMRARGWFLPGLRRTLAAGRRVAQIFTHNPMHASTQLAASFPFLPGGRLALAARLPLAEQTARLEAYRPTMLNGYPSAVDLLARAQLEGRLDISPRIVLTGGETMPAGMRERARAAWNAEVFDFYGSTETLLIAFECRAHQGMHIAEDAVLLEVVDDGDRPVLPGELGSAVLVTNLYNRTLPIIRYRVGDRMAVVDEPCPCGLPFARITRVEGRRDEVLGLRAADGGLASVPPVAIEEVLEGIPEVRRFQLRSAGGEVRIAVLPRAAAEGLAARIEARVAENLAPYRLAPGAIRVEIVTDLDAEYGRTDKRRRVLHQGSAAEGAKAHSEGATGEGSTVPPWGGTGEGPKGLASV